MTQAENPSGPVGKSSADPVASRGTNTKNVSQRQANRDANARTYNGPKQIAPSVQPARPDNSFAAYSDKPQPKSPKATPEY